MRRSTLIIRDALFVNSFILGILLVQYLVFYLSVGFFEEQSLIFFMFALLAGLSLIGGVFYRRRAMAWGNALFLLVNFALAGYMVLFFDGPFNILVLVLGIIMICLNVAGLYLNLRCLKSSVFAGDDFFVPSTWRQDRQRGAVKAIVVLGLIGFLGIASACSFWVSYTVRAPDGMQTKSSYWGPPSLTLATYTGRIYPDSNTTLWISNSTLDPNLLPLGYQNGTLAYVTNVSIPGSSHNYLNYSAGARSYPNGSIFLGENITDISDVNITFQYVLNSVVLAYLSLGNSTLIMNYVGPFIYNNDPFAYIQYNYLFQLLDYWNITFYLSIDSQTPGAFVNVYNYLDVTPVAYQTLNWGRQWVHFLGISFDMEGGGAELPGQHPGRPLMYPGEWIPNSSEFYYSWYGDNEQNATLYQAAWTGFEGIYAYAQYLGLKVYDVMGGEFRDGFDGDQDVNRVPIIPTSDKPNVLYGMMSYHDSDATTGRYELFKDCVQQIQVYGDRGRSILTGWIANGTTYYTDDEAGFQRYEEDVLIAQAAGMTEVVHAPIYRLQAKWGDDAILRLYQALNVEPKQTFTLSAPVFKLDRTYVEDVVKNFDRPWVFVLALLGIVAWISLFGVGMLWEEVKEFRRFRHEQKAERTDSAVE